MKITRILQPALTEEIEITFPFYRVQHDRFYYYGIDADNVISVSANKYYANISHMILVEANVFHANSEYTTKEIFESKFEEAKVILTNLINQ